MSTATEQLQKALLGLEAAQAGKHYTFQGRTYEPQSPTEAMKAYEFWERRVRDEARAASGHAGGFRYRSADFTGCNQ